MVGKKDLHVLIKIFGEDILDLPPLKIGVLKLLEEREVEASGDPIDVLMRISEEESKSKKGSYIEIKVTSPDTTYIIGETPRYRWRKKLTFKPEPLLRIGVLRGENKGDSIMNFKLDDLEWYEVPRSERLYVYEGSVEPKVNDIILIVLETEEGRSYIKPVYALRSRKFSQTPR